MKTRVAECPDIISVPLTIAEKANKLKADLFLFFYLFCDFSIFSAFYRTF